ncbi:MAG TPA: prepilin-type N-terminal cleavage/methylation domain-containing protein [Conexibacter sp.]|nr:prepilin-type N-terminal cleavage/methylation domain-containing protein [Conexibacter sp.]
MRRLLHRLRQDQRGFTLMELVVATTLGTLVLLAAGRISTSMLHAQTRISDRSEAIARGRTAMEQIVQQLRSQVCLGPGYPAITYGDNARVTFYADLANRSTFVPEQRDLQFASGALTQRDYPGTATGALPPFTFARTPSRTRVILDRIELQRTSGGATVPFFRFYSFDGNNPVRPSRLLTTPLSTNDAQRVVQITVAFQSLPSRGGSGAANGEPFTANVFVRTADPTDPEHSPLCI